MSTSIPMEIYITGGEENFMELKLGNFVTIVCEIPYGLWKNDSHTPHVKGRLGTITEIIEDKDDVYFVVKDEKGDEFVYTKCELIPAFEADIRRALRELLERR